MSLGNKLNVLLFKHAKKDEAIHKAYVNHLDDQVLVKLKKEKLKIKDQLYSYQNT